MTGLSALSDDDLRALYAEGAQPAPSPAAPNPFEGMSDNQLRTLALKSGIKEAGKLPPKDTGTQGYVGAVANNLVEGVPVVGPIIGGAMDRYAAGLRSLTGGKAYGDELKDIQTRDAGYDEEHPYLSTSAQIGGAIAGTIPLMAAAPVAMGIRGATLGARAAAGATSGAGIGAADAGVRSGGDLKATGTGALLGAAVGGAAPYVGRGLGWAGETVAAPLMARLRPDNATRTQMLRAMQRAGLSPDEITQALRDATADGQNVFTVADALGHPGQRVLSTIARTPGDGRQAVVEALDNRQAGQGRRIATALSEGFDAPDTAAQRVATLTDARRTAGDAGYTAARDSAGAVDVSPAVAAIDDVLSPGVTRLANPGSNIANDSVEAALTRARGILTDGRSNLTDFSSVLRAKQDIDDMVERAIRSGSNNQARMLTSVRQHLDDALANASEPYAAARDAYRQGSRQIEAVDTGRRAATRGRSEDTTRAFANLSPEEQAAFRAGYADPLIEGAQGAAVGNNKARPLLNDATAVEFPEFAAPGRGEQLGNRLQREQTMFETRNQAMGGSRTADNTADQAELGMIDPTIIGAAIAGNWKQALASGANRAMAELRGMPEGVRTRLATILLQNDATEAGRQLAQAVARGADLTERQIATARAALSSYQPALAN